MMSPWFDLGRGHDELADRLEEDRVGLRHRFLEADRPPAILKLISDESTEWYLPSKQVTFTSTTGKPKTPPCSIVSCTPFSTAGMNWRGIAPPTIASTNSKPVPRSSGSTRRNATPNWPWPPVCFL